MQPSALRPMVPAGMHFEAEIEVNDFPQHARWKARLPTWPFLRSRSLKICFYFMCIFQSMIGNLEISGLGVCVDSCIFQNITG